ncbi:MAG: polymer-forming cytoskeletal protein [Gemmatimonadales bacterium]
MAIWKENAPPRETSLPSQPTRQEPETRPELSSSYGAPPRPAARAVKESLIAEELTIEGKIEGSGHVRIAGRFKGDVHVQGNLSIEPGATLTGGVRANTVTIGGQLEGNIDAATRVELLETGVLSGDLSADALIVAAGSRMRGKVEFGWDNKTARTSGGLQKGPQGAGAKSESGSAA